MVVEEEPDAQHPGRPQARLVRQHEAHAAARCAGRCATAPRARSAPRAPAGNRTARDSAGRRGSAWSSARRCRCARSSISHRKTEQAAPGRVAGDAAAVDAAADDGQVVDVAARQPAAPLNCPGRESRSRTRRPCSVSRRRMVPPCAVTSSCATASPRPVPPLRAEPWKAWNRWARAFSGTPGPSSLTSMVTRVPLRCAGDADVALCRLLLLERLQGVAARGCSRRGTAGRDRHRRAALARSRWSSRWRPRAAGPGRRRPPRPAARSGISSRRGAASSARPNLQRAVGRE